MEALEAILYSVRAKDEDGNVYETSVRAASEEEAVAGVRARGLIDAEARPVEAKEEATDADARQAWQRFQEDLKDLPGSGEPFGPAVAEGARAAAARSLEFSATSYGVSEDAEAFLAAVKETISRTGDAPDLRAAHAVQKGIDAQWRARTRPTFVFLGTLLTLLMLLWLFTALSPVLNATQKAAQTVYDDFDMQRSHVSRHVEDANRMARAFAWVVVVALAASLSVGHVWRASRMRTHAAPGILGLAEHVTERWPLLGRILCANRRARFLAAMAELSRSGMNAAHAAAVAAALAESPGRYRRARLLLRSGAGARSYCDVIRGIDRAVALSAAAEHPRIGIECPSKLVAALSENITEQTSTLCARLTTLTLGLTGVLALLWLAPGGVSPLSLFSNLIPLMNAMGG